MLFLNVISSLDSVIVSSFPCSPILICVNVAATWFVAPIIVLSIVPPLISAVVATKELAVVTPVLETVRCSVPPFSSILKILEVCPDEAFTFMVISLIVSPIIEAPEFTTNPSFVVNVVNVPAAGVTCPNGPVNPFVEVKIPILAS